ncbi:MAG: MFS transporter [Rhodococcus sp. (in: high G+C Gram-positive bacteria)]
MSVQQSAHSSSVELSRATRVKTAAAVGIGNFMEWFDFAVYGFFATIIGRLFFPESTALVSLLASLSVFAVGFLMRPLGGLILGPIGDKHGRKTALVLSVLLMGGATTIMGVLPTYATVGVVAPVLLLILRCIQGVAAGGEWSGSAAYLLESAPNNRRGVYASLISGTAALAFVAGSLFALWLNNSLDAAQLDAWGWRIPFLLAAPMSLIGLFIRMRLGDTPVFEALKAERDVADAPLKAAGTKNLKPVLITFALSAVSGLGIYFLATYINNYLSVTAGLSRPDALLLSVIGLSLYMLMCPVAGALSDRYGRRIVNLTGTAGFVVLTIPAFMLLSTGSSVPIVVGLALFGVCQALCSVTNVALLVELFPASTRSSGSALGYNLGLALIAGPGPLVAAALVASTSNPVSPAWYVVAVALPALLAIAKWMPETYKSNLTES